MNYWLCITNEENWDVIKEENIWGVSEKHKNQLNRVEIDDFFVFYLKQEEVEDKMLPSRISGIFKATSRLFKDEKKIFSSVGFRDEVFPYRVRLEPTNLPKDPIQFKPLIQKLEFITNKKRWSTHLIGRAMRTIPKVDFEVITSKLQ